jgi:branched-subunit amino acid ABC-type transport system permease component
MIIGALVSLLIQALRQYLPGIVGRVLLAFGIGMTVNKVVMPALENFVRSKVGGLPSVLYSYFGATGFDVAVTLILSAIFAARAQRVIMTKLGG